MAPTAPSGIFASAREGCGKLSGGLRLSSGFRKWACLTCLYTVCAQEHTHILHGASVPSRGFPSFPEASVSGFSWQLWLCHTLGRCVTPSSIHLIRSTHLLCRASGAWRGCLSLLTASSVSHLRTSSSLLIRSNDFHKSLMAPIDELSQEGEANHEGCALCLCIYRKLCRQGEYINIIKLNLRHDSQFLLAATFSLNCFLYYFITTHAIFISAKMMPWKRVFSHPFFSSKKMFVWISIESHKRRRKTQQWDSWEKKRERVVPFTSVKVAALQRAVTGHSLRPVVWECIQM